MEIISLPVPEKILDLDINTDIAELSNYVVDISSIKYDDPDLESNKVECSLIYFRNLDLPLACDFSKLTFEEKEEWLLKYINSDLFDLNIRELIETILNLLADEPLEDFLSILTFDEIKLFKNKHKDLLDEMIRFIVSSKIILDYAISKADCDEVCAEIEKNSNLPIIKEKPSFFETIHSILVSYPLVFDALNLYYTEKVDPVIYEYLLLSIEKSSVFYLNYLQLPSIKFIGLLLDDDNTIKDITDDR